jgi:hypothetical protein
MAAAINRDKLLKKDNLTKAFKIFDKVIGHIYYRMEMGY